MMRTSGSSRCGFRARSAQRAIAVLVCAAALGLTGCGEKSTSSKDLTFVDVAKAQEMIKGSRGILGVGGSREGAFVDARTKDKFAEGHIPGAISMPFATVWNDHKKLKGIKPLIIYGDDFGDPIAEGMSKRLIELGYGDVRTLRGGMRAWKAAEYEVESEESN